MSHPHGDPLGSIFKDFAGSSVTDFLDGIFGSKTPLLSTMLAEASGKWPEGTRRKAMSPTEKAYLKGQAELIVGVLVRSGELTLSPLHPDEESLVKLVSNRIVES